MDWLTDAEFWRNRRPSGRTTACVIGCGILLVGTILWANLRKSPHDAQSPQRTRWLCPNGHEFSLTAQQLDEHFAKHRGEPVLCPSCGAPASRAVVCRHCGNLVAPPPGERICPKCRRPLSP